MAIERAGAVTFQGNPLTAIGAAVNVGDKAPDFKLLANDLSEVILDSEKGKVRLILSVPSLDTAVCDAETRRFNETSSTFPGNVVIYSVSCDLPFAQGRWCGAADVQKVKTLSDHRDVSFGEAYGTLIKELRLLSRAIFLIDADDIVQYVQYVLEVTDHPDYDAACAAVNRASG